MIFIPFINFLIMQALRIRVKSAKYLAELIRHTSLSYRRIAAFELIQRIPDSYPEVVHGCCYALASLCSTHSLPDDIILNIMQATLPILFDVNNMYDYFKSVVADGVCYLFWACVREYTAVLAQITDDVLSTLVVTSLTNEDLTIRRASAAVMQEFVGRLGNENVDHGLELMNLISFHSLSLYYTTYAVSSIRNSQNDGYSAEGRSSVEVSAEPCGSIETHHPVGIQGGSERTRRESALLCLP